jgi:glucose-induced degradation protein 8
MALLIFPHDDTLKPELAELLDPSLRRKVADMTNKAVLQRHTKRRDAALRNLLKTRSWSENKARELKKDIPDRLDLGLDTVDGDRAVGTGFHENGHEPMITT